MKRILTIFLLFLNLVNVFSINISATSTNEKNDECIVVFDIFSATKRSLLSIESDNDAVCTSIFDDDNGDIYSVTAVQILEKKGVFGIFLTNCFTCPL